MTTEGPECGHCTATEARCAFRGGCCEACTHFADDDGVLEDGIDEAAILRALDGDRAIPLSRDEVTEVWQRLERRGLSAAEVADVLGVRERTVVRWRTTTTERPYPRPAGGWTMTTPTVPDTIAATVARGRSHPTGRIRAAAARVDAALDQLRTLLADDEGKAEARREVERLERQLAEAKAKLRGGSRPATKLTRGQPVDCPECGQSCGNPQGLAAHTRTKHKAA